MNWPAPNFAGFSNMEGSFRHGRAEFFPPSAFDGRPPRAERFTFSDALPNSCRWDMATPVEGGAWRTVWIMEFSRTLGAAKTIAAGEPISKPPAECVCKAENAWQLDGIVGAWQGEGGDCPPFSKGDLFAIVSATIDQAAVGTSAWRYGVWSLSIAQRTPMRRSATDRSACPCGLPRARRAA